MVDGWLAREVGQDTGIDGLADQVFGLVSSQPDSRHAAAAQALAEALRGKAMPGGWRDAMGGAIVRRVGTAQASIDAGGRLMQGWMRGACGQAKRMRAEQLNLMFDQVILELERGPSTGGAGLLVSRIQALAAGIGGPDMRPRELGLLLDLVHCLQALVGHAEPPPIQAEDLALAIRAICMAAGGPAMPLPLVQTVLARVLAHGPIDSGPQRGCMVYHLAAALRMADRPREDQAWLLGQVVLANRDGFGPKLWGLGLHLTGTDPEAAGWHTPYQHIVAQTRAPAHRVIAAVLAHAASFEPRAQSWIVCGLHAALSDIDPQGSPARQARGRLALRVGIRGVFESEGASHRWRAMELGYVLGEQRALQAAISEHRTSANVQRNGRPS